MHHRIISATEARSTVEHLLNDKDRSTKIAILSLEEVNLYMSTVKTLQANFENIIRQFSKLNSNFLDPSRNHPTVSYRGYVFSYNWFTREVTITPRPPFEELMDLLLELEQQKEHLIRLNTIESKLQDKVSRIEALDKQESKMTAESVISSISDAQDQVALQALGSYHSLVNQTRGVFDQFKTLKNQEDLLQSTLSKNEELQKDNETLQFQLNALQQENQKNINSALNAKLELAEQKTELSCLKSKDQASQIPRQSLVDLLNTFGYKSGFGLFSSSGPEDTIEKLKQVSKTDKEFVSFEQIKNCMTNLDDLKLFNYPLAPSDKLLSKTGLLIRELALLFHTPKEQKAAPSI